MHYYNLYKTEKNHTCSVIYIYIYIYMCVCVCVCVYVLDITCNVDELDTTNIL